MASGSVGAGPDHEVVPAAAAWLFGDRLHLAVRYAALLAQDGVPRGLIGPAEVGRLWSRHLLNCAVIGEAIGPELRVCDVGSGAGLPGIALAIARPDLRIDLVEPMERRAAFLRETVTALELVGVRVHRQRAEEVARGQYDVVTARAVAPLLRLIPLALPLAIPGGMLLAAKGAKAADELAAAARAIAECGGSKAAVFTLGVSVLDSPTTVVRVVRTGVRANANRVVAADVS